MKFGQKKPNAVLITGGAGYIGSHLAIELLKLGHRIVIIDDLSNSHEETVLNLKQVFHTDVTFILGDVRDEKLLHDAMKEENIETVFHLAGLKSVQQSFTDPINYYDTNVIGTVNLIRSMKQASIFKLIFSSSATVYGEPISLPVDESHPSNRGTNPYGISKQVAEQLLNGLAIADDRWKIGVLRYFNPAGAEESGIIGESPKTRSTNLFPNIIKVASGCMPSLEIFGNNYDTLDGTGVRDYIHVTDLAKGHIAAMKAISNKSGIFTWNLGTGRGHSVNEILTAFESVTKQSISRHYSERRSGEVAKCYADTSKANLELNWQATKGIDDMARDAWRWHTKNAILTEEENI
jgi:UDP-glucose 4-epimerase